MPIFLEEPKPAITQMVKSEVEDIIRNKHFDTTTLALDKTKPLSLVDPHRIYDLSTDDIGNAGFLERADLSGWRYLIEAGMDVVASAKWFYKDDNEKGAFGGFDYGYFNAPTREAFQIAEQAPQLRSDRYQPQLVRVLPYGVMALWLKHHSDDRSLDIYIPLSPARTPFTANSLMSRDAFAAALVVRKANHRTLPPDSSP